MSGIKISQLPTATSLTGSELLAIVQGGVTKRVTATSLGSVLSSSNNASLLSTGTLANARLTANVVLNNVENAFTENQEFTNLSCSGGINVQSAETFSLQVYEDAIVDGGIVCSGLTINGTATATLFSGSGASLTTLNATNLSSGTVADARLSANIPRLNAQNVFSAGAYFSGGATVIVNDLWLDADGVSTVGTIINRYQVFNTEGDTLGYIPIYSAS